MRITNFCTRVKVSNVMTRAHFGVDILRDVGSGGGTNLVFPSTAWLGLTTAALTRCCDNNNNNNNIRYELLSLLAYTMLT